MALGKNGLAERNKKYNKLNASEKYSNSLIGMNESSFKIRRFMNDVNVYRGNSNVEEDVNGGSHHEHKKRINEEDVNGRSHNEHRKRIKAKKTKNLFETSEKENVDPRSRLTGKKGLFEKGVSTKIFSRGLMPPMWNARLNSDLQTILNLACGKSKKRHKPSASSVGHCDGGQKSLQPGSPESMSNGSKFMYETEMKANPSKKLPKLLESGIPSDRGSLLHSNSPEMEATERERELPIESSIGEMRGVQRTPEWSRVQPRQSHRMAVPMSMPSADNVESTRSDFYLQFSHFIIKSLSSSRIDRLQVEKCSKMAVTSLAELYRLRLSEDDDSQEFEKEKSSPSRQNSSQNSESIREQVRACPFTSRSDEGPSYKRIPAPTVARSADDIDVRKSKLYSSGLELLEAVYGNANDNRETTGSFVITPPDCTFSPIVDHTRQEEEENLYSKTDYGKNPTNYWPKSYDSVNREPYYTDCQPSCCDYGNNCNTNCEMTGTIEEDANPSQSLRYWPGLSRKPHSMLHCNNNNYQSTNRNTTALANSTLDCLSILPPNFRKPELYKGCSHNFYGRQTAFGMEANNECGDDRNCTNTASMLTLPLRAPPRASPDINYYPRRMF